MITLTFACGHAGRWQDGDPDPRCPVCGETRIARVQAPPPRITGAVVLPRKESAA